MLTFAQLQITLATHLGVAEENRAKFRMRIQQLQRGGWPRGANNGRKKRMAYTAQQLLELAFAFELIELGLSPERATGLVEFWWDNLRKAFLLARDKPFPIIFGFIQGDFAGLLPEADLAARIEDGTVTIGIDPRDSADQLRAALRLLGRSRASLINVSDVLSGLTTGMKEAGVESALVWAQTETWR